MFRFKLTRKSVCLNNCLNTLRVFLSIDVSIKEKNDKSHANLLDSLTVAEVLFKVKCYHYSENFFKIRFKNIKLKYFTRRPKCNRSIEL